jgi:putative cardiolipin synthase
MDALGARLYLIEKAEQSIDAQYFLMKDDHAGHILASALFAAADRGVRVRFLLDDIFTTATDKNLALLDRHPNIQVRLFNPIARGGIFYLNFFADFKRANRRMHNKTLTVDNQATIVGGRNIADEYFRLKTDAEFIDFDIIGIGPVAVEVNSTFDLFWNAEQSVPLEAIDDSAKSVGLNEARIEIATNEIAADRAIYAEAMQSAFLEDLMGGTLALYSSDAVVITDAPEKLVQQVSEQQQTLVNYLSEIARNAREEIIIVTPYFVPQQAGIDFWREIAAKDVRVIVLTNSLASTNHIAVHSGYARHRKEILKAGGVLYAARANAIETIDGNDYSSPETLTLHSKGVIIDREAVFAGSLNMDPRSIDINAEMGILIRSPEMADSLADDVMTDILAFAYRVELNDTGELRWRGIVDSAEVIKSSEPLASGWRRFKAFLLKIGPESQL